MTALIYTTHIIDGGGPALTDCRKPVSRPLAATESNTSYRAEWVGTALALGAEAQHGERLSVEVLLAQVAAGDPAAFTELYGQTKDTIFAIISGVLQDRSRAEDTVQEVYLQLWLTGAKRYDPAYGSAWPYLKTVARRRAFDQLRTGYSAQRRQHAARHQAIEHRPGADVADVAVTRLDLHSALSGLAERSKRVLALYYYIDLTHAEIARLLDMPIGTVKTHHSRALTAMRIALQNSSDRAR